MGWHQVCSQDFTLEARRLHSCCGIVSAVGWTWWDWSLVLKNLSSFSALTLLVGSLTRKTVPYMTYNVFGGTLNLAQSINYIGGTQAAMVHFLLSKKFTTFFSHCRQNLSSGYIAHRTLLVERTVLLYWIQQDLRPDKASYSCNNSRNRRLEGPCPLSPWLRPWLTFMYMYNVYITFNTVGLYRILTKKTI